MHDTREYAGFFVVLEGAHGSGKTTQAGRLSHWLSDLGFPVQSTREVGGTVLGEKLRCLIEDPQWAKYLEHAPKSLLFLVLAARNLHVLQVIRPALQQSKIVICERFAGSTYAIQHFADRLEWDMVHRMHTFSSEDITPHLNILLDIPARQGIARKQRQGTHGFWDKKPIEYHERIVQGYRDATCYLPNCVVVDAAVDTEHVFAEVQRHVLGLLDRPSAR